MKAGISHLGSVGPVLLPCCCTSDSKCSVYLYGFQTNSCWSHGSQTSARWQRAATSLLLDRWCARKKPAYAKCLVRTRSRAAWRRAPGPITAVYVSEMLNRSHLSERCNGERRFVREHNRPADEVFEMRPSRCGNKIKLERQQIMKWLSPNFQDADVIALAVALFQLAAVWDDTEHLLFMYQSQIQHKDLSLFSRPQSQGRCKADRDEDDSPPRSFLFILWCLLLAAFLFFKHVKEVGAMHWHRGQALTHGLLDNHILAWPTWYWSVSVVFVFSYFTFAVKNSRFVFGQMDRSWLLLPREEINSAVDRGPCLSLGFIRCWCWQCERTTCTRKKIEGRKERERERLEKVGCCTSR